ncbi:ead/Ea22-like family protein [Salmonella enterica]|uniref:ead/Ea22-like family protein n=1 Tax=Salmonella enterica TaxID=28901 RepID=UPI00065D46AB|nr:ead/Ea22-like family protein [Salmonella enterica]ECC9859570.1 ead/Ea22-like family protein [Salmonella enterica subsp. enterica]KMJ40166.1 bacteriophage protein [Salmonella enterica subsp. enterica serovar Typhimurium]ECG1561011.1 ead/Ea22-like family protein [Salmonella enterica subsp. enterica]EFV1553944.1 ead/Ea22-like family protein [Salmonella enterica]EJP5978605.1 ead/Ea22-like family protein [Salmonella enterica]
MSNIDKRALREVAERATPGNWRRTSSLFNGITVTPFSLCGEEVTLAHTVEKRDAEFIAAANPRTMLALLDENIQLQRGKDAIEAVALALRDDMRDAREKLEAAEHRKVLNSIAAVARRYLPDYDEHPEIQAADELLESAAGIGVKGE